jgi:hypothetical protein
MALDLLSAISKNRCLRRDSEEARLETRSLAMAARIIKTLRSWSEGVCIKLNSQGPRKILHPSHAFEVQIFWNFEASLIDPEGENPFPLDS